MLSESLMSYQIDEKINLQLQSIAESQPYPLLVTTVSGAHLYGFPSPDSDYDLRGVHVLPLPEVIGLNEGRQTIEVSRHEAELELDLVTHDIKKFFGLLLKRNGYVLEQLYSPLIVQTTLEHEELKAIAQGCITRYHSHHYLGFAKTQWRLFSQAEQPRVKPLLYVYRVLLTGIYLMRSGEIEANLLKLNESAKLPYLADLIDRKLQQSERCLLETAEIEFHQTEYNRLVLELEAASDQSDLQEEPTAQAALHELLVRIRCRAIESV
jgi:uncharacterized protein